MNIRFVYIITIFLMLSTVACQQDAANQSTVKKAEESSGYKISGKTVNFNPNEKVYVEVIDGKNVNKLAELKDSGIITEEEFKQMKQRILDKLATTMYCSFVIMRAISSNWIEAIHKIIKFMVMANRIKSINWSEKFVPVS